MHPDLREIKSKIEMAVKAVEPYGDDTKVTITGSVSTWRVLLDALADVPFDPNVSVEVTVIPHHNV